MSSEQIKKKCDQANIHGTAFHSRVKCTDYFVNKIFSVIENQNKQQIRHKKIGANEVYD